MDDPIADEACLPVYFISKFAREKGIKVLLSGEGGDEIFGGYPRYILHRIFNLIDFFGGPLRKSLLRTFSKAPFLPERLTRILMKLSVDADDDLYLWLSYFEEKEKIKMLKIKSGNSWEKLSPLLLRKTPTHILNNIFYMDIKTWLVEDILMKADKMSMANSVEIRTPFLDHHLVEFSLKIPPHLKVRWKTKFIFKKAFEGLLPEEVLKRPKKPFFIPLHEWMTSSWLKIIEFMLRKKGCLLHEILDVNYISHLLKEGAGRDYSKKLFIILTLGIWMEIFLNKKEPEEMTELLRRELTPSK